MCFCEPDFRRSPPYSSPREGAAPIWRRRRQSAFDFLKIFRFFPTECARNSTVYSHRHHHPVPVGRLEGVEVPVRGGPEGGGLDHGEVHLGAGIATFGRGKHLKVRYWRLN